MWNHITIVLKSPCCFLVVCEYVRWHACPARPSVYGISPQCASRMSSASWFASIVFVFSDLISHARHGETKGQQTILNNFMANDRHWRSVNAVLGGSRQHTYKIFELIAPDHATRGVIQRAWSTRCQNDEIKTTN